MSERFVISKNGFEVSVLDTQNDVTNENLLMFGVDCSDEESAFFMMHELEAIVDCLNEQDKELRRGKK